MDIKAIIMDIDGTLVNDEKKITKATKEALLKAQTLGYKLVLASGRPTTGLKDLALELEMDLHNGLLVSYNGSCATSLPDNKILVQHMIDVTKAKAIIKHLQAFDVTIMIDLDGYLYVNSAFKTSITYRNRTFNVVEYEASIGDYLVCEVKDLTSIITKPVYKILVACSNEYLLENIDAMIKPWHKQATTVMSSPFFLEFTDLNVDKASALEESLALDGINPSQM
ncbi:MAG: HAD hydrolase family protein, partial [Bacilli bacterium]